VLLVAESIAALGVPWIAGHLASSLLSSPARSVAAANAWLLLLLALFTCQAGLSFGHGYLISRAGEQLVSDLRARVYDHLQALPLGFHFARRRGETLALLTRDVQAVSWFISGGLVSLLPLVLTFFGALILMARLDPVLAACAGISVPLFLTLIKLVGRSIRPISHQLAREHAAAVAIAEENLGMLPAIKAFTREVEESGRYRAQLHRILGLSARQLVRQLALAPITQLLAATGIVLLVGLAGRRVAHGLMTPGDLVSLLLYGLMLTRPVSGLARVYGQWQNARSALTRLEAVLGERPEALGPKTARPAALDGAIAFERVSFAYPGRPTLLDAIDLFVGHRETVALTGPNGAGKSTIAHLLMRFFSPDAGSIRIQGIDVASVPLQALRRQIGLVPQHPLLLHGTVRDNIAYGALAPTDQAIEQAARAARAHEFIESLPQGYETVIGDQGVRISGGQKQRLALARALLKDPPILILDEATAMYDPRGEEDLLVALEALFRTRTVLLITHRPALLALADRVLRVERGQVAEVPAVNRVAGHLSSPNCG
jgi:ATP-binding cassette subfamily B protein